MSAARWPCVDLWRHFNSGSTLFAKAKSIFRERNIYFFGNYNLWPLNIYNGPSWLNSVKLFGKFDWFTIIFFIFLNQSICWWFSIEQSQWIFFRHSLPQSSQHHYFNCLFLRYSYVVKHIYPGIQFRLPCTPPRTIFHGCQIVHWDPLDGKRRCPQKNFGLGYVKLHGFYANP